MECPENASGWRQREDARRCPGDTFYHCLRDEVGTARESCLEKTWVQPGFCPEFNSVAKKMDVSLCKESRGKCPTRTFWSNDVYMYSACLPTTPIATTPVFSKPTIPGDDLTIATPQSTTSKPNRDISGAGENGAPAAVAIILPIIFVLLVCFVVGLVLYIVYKRRWKKNDKPGDADTSTRLHVVDIPSAAEEDKLRTEQEKTKLMNDDYSKDAEKTEILIPAAMETSDGKKISTDGKFEYAARFESVGKIVEKAGPLLNENGILVLVSPSKKCMTEVANSVSLTSDTQDSPYGFKEFNDSFAEMEESSDKTKCVVFNNCFQKNGITIKIQEHKSIFIDLYKKQVASGGKLRFVITVPVTIWNARSLTLSSMNLFNEKFVLKFKDPEIRNSKAFPV